MIEHVTITILTTFTLLQVFGKWGWLDVYEARYGHIRWLPSASCFLCLGFWLSIPVALLYWAACALHAQWLFLPFACAGAINFLTIMMKK